jgi:hypothetical protein
MPTLPIKNVVLNHFGSILPRLLLRAIDELPLVHSDWVGTRMYLIVTDRKQGMLLCARIRLEGRMVGRIWTVQSGLKVTRSELGKLEKRRTSLITGTGMVTMEVLENTMTLSRGERWRNRPRKKLPMKNDKQRSCMFLVILYVCLLLNI